MPLSKLIDTLHKEGCSLVLEDAQGNIRLFFKKGVRDLEDLLNNESGVLYGSTIADKVVGKAAAGIMAYGGIKEVYADVMSRKALPMLEADGISYSYGELVDQIVIPKGDNRCPLEKIVATVNTPEEVVKTLFNHFEKVASIARH